MKKPPKKTEIPTAADVNTIAEVFGLTPRSIQNLEKQGIAVRVAHGQYDLVASVRNYITSLQAEASPQEDSEFAVARTRVYRARAEILEAQSQALRGQLHDAELVKEVVTEGISDIRAKFLAIPTRLAPILADEPDPAKCSEIIRDAIYEALTECSKYNGREVVRRYLAKQNKAPARSEQEDLQEVL
jgi:phage terminase Nu1 subunit (DNA packaging protein)